MTTGNNRYRESGLTEQNGAWNYGSTLGESRGAAILSKFTGILGLNRDKCKLPHRSSSARCIPVVRIIAARTFRSDHSAAMALFDTWLFLFNRHTEIRCSPAESEHRQTRHGVPVVPRQCLPAALGTGSGTVERWPLPRRKVTFHTPFRRRT